MWSNAQTVEFAQSSLKQKNLYISSEEIRFMLWTILVVLLLLWLVGFYGGFVTNSLIHLLLVAAVIVLALNLFRRRNPA